MKVYIIKKYNLYLHDFDNENNLFALVNCRDYASELTEEEADEFCRIHDGFEKEFAHNVISIKKIEL